ncbi:phosphotransferase family protein [Paraconexibacter algicola]|uniref:phosphotransferase family protein n=1 Tax=Paraconexibacter algicola TaxID=2133960 RepID=UPI0018EE8E15|nr:phosphotransferase family protein [Paraconexibacter algicola]
MSSSASASDPTASGPGGRGVPVDGPLSAWLTEHLGDPGPFVLDRLSGGNSNETLLLRSPTARRILRRPPHDAIDPSAHDMAREHTLLTALAQTDVPAPAPLALIDDPAVVPAPALVMEAAEGHALLWDLPGDRVADAATLTGIGEAVMDALGALHRADWRAAGLDGFGRPDGFLDRQVGRWTRQLDRYRVRELPWHAEIASWLAAHQPADGEPGILHGDFHLDNCLVTLGEPPAVAAIIDWEMATIGDPLLDVGLFLGFWGDERPATPAMPKVQAVTRGAGAPGRAVLAARYEEASGRSLEHLDWYMTLAFWKLATIVEGAYAQFLAGALTTPYARDLEHDVPRLLEEAATFAGLR